MLKGLLTGVYSIVTNILLDVVVFMVTSVPVYVCWNFIAPKNLQFLPEQYIHFSYWEVLSILLLSIYVGNFINRIIPRIIFGKSKTSKFEIKK